MGTRAPEDSEEDGEAGVEPKEAVEQARLDMPHGPAHSRRFQLRGFARGGAALGENWGTLSADPTMLLILMCPVLVPLLNRKSSSRAAQLAARRIGTPSWDDFVPTRTAPN